MRSKTIDSIDLVTSVNKRLEEYFSTINTQISKMISGDTKVENTKALNQCKQIEKQCNAIAIQIKVQIEKIIQDAYKTSIKEVVEEYKKYFADLNLNVNSSALAFSPISLVSASLADLSSIIKDNTQIVDESYEIDEEYQVKIKGTKGRNAAIGAATGAAIGSFIPGIGTLIGGIAGALFGAAGGAISGESEHYETRTRKKLIKKEGQYLDMRSISKEYTQEFQESVINVKDQTTDFVKKETDRLKDYLKEELKKIDEVLKNKLDSLSKVEADSKIKAEELAKKRANLKWLEDIQGRVTNIINF
jgi:outer membrane lipoprotein SlyB